MGARASDASVPPGARTRQNHSGAPRPARAPDARRASAQSPWNGRSRAPPQATEPRRHDHSAQETRVASLDAAATEPPSASWSSHERASGGDLAPRLLDMAREAQLRG